MRCTPRHATPRHATPRHATPRHATQFTNRHPAIRHFHVKKNILLSRCSFVSPDVGNSAKYWGAGTKARPGALHQDSSRKFRPIVRTALCGGLIVVLFTFSAFFGRFRFNLIQFDLTAGTICNFHTSSPLAGFDQRLFYEGC